MHSSVGKNLFSCIFICIITIDVSEVLGFSIKNEFVPAINITRSKRLAESTCSRGFKCKISEECLPIDTRCDGIVNCRDGSDEFDDCKTAVQCPGFTYICDYGACVDGDAKCDGKKDCRDNSDEANCPNSSKLMKSKDQSNCTSDQFKCLSGQCISEIDKCDGVPNCRDQSDESKDTCLNKYCPGWTFKCAYGACVDGDAKCDGHQQCFDNSDEEGCEPAKPTVPKETARPTKPPVPTEPPDIADTPGGCLLPSHPENGKWEIQGQIVGWTPGQRVAASTVLAFSCESGHKMSGAKYVVCLSEDWTEEPPICTVLCPPLYSTAIMKVKCHNSDQVEIRCDEATDGATAEYECSPFYEPSEKIVQTRICIYRNWNLPVPRCIPVCGEKIVSAEPLIVTGLIGQNVSRGNYPWVAAVFQKIENEFKNVCGGSMLSQRVILTAAHCVSNGYGDAISVDLVNVAVGKYYNRFGDKRDHQAQYSDVDNIIIHPRFKGDFRKYQCDIAFLITTDVLLLSKVVQPICYSNLNRIHLINGVEGIVTGWGYTTSDSDPSDVLKEIPVPYKDEITCTRELPRDWANTYYVIDKFCAGHHNQSSGVCKGDSGGGLAIRYPGDDRFYVHGIVSVTKTITGKGGCDIEYSALYTNVALYYSWLELVVSRYSS